MRTLLATAVLGLLTYSLVGSPSTALLDQDGITAKITISGNGVANEVFRPDADGNYAVLVIIYQNVGGVWQTVGIDATLRVFTWGDNAVQASATPSTSPVGVSVSASASFHGDWTDKVSIPFHSSAGGPVKIKFPKAAIENPDGTGSVNGFDLFVTFSQFSTPTGTPTSHHNVVKNVLIDRAQYDQADALDHEGTIFAYGLGQ